jgi:GNAT superfamily N-acetyltransferase
MLLRNSLDDGPWSLRPIEDYSICRDFDCGDDDLNDYFHTDALLHRNQLLTQSYWLRSSDFPSQVLALLDFCNDYIHFEHEQPSISKHYHHYPAVKLTRFGVQKEYQGKNIGTAAINMVKKLFITENRTGCRYITVDAYQKEYALKFYQKNEFIFLTEIDPTKKSIPIYYDLWPLSVRNEYKRG